MNRSCLGCGENILLDKEFENRIFDKAESDIQKLVKLGKSEKELREFPFEYFIPDRELYCNSCSDKIVTEEDKVRDMLFYSVNRNRTINLLLDRDYIFYSNKGFSNKFEKKKFIFLFSYIEECQSLCSEIIEELNLLFIRFVEHTVLNHDDFSYMYYFRNVSMKTVSLVEKLTVFYATVFKVEFRKNKLQNKPEALLKKLRKKENFGDTVFCSMITSYRQSGNSFKIEKCRKFDIDNRLHEVSRSHCITFNILMNAHGLEIEIDKITIGNSTGKNYSSLINDMVYRIYSITDKLATLINIKFDLNPQNDYLYFEDISELIGNNKQFISNNFQLYKAIKNILDCNEYKYLATNRNRMHHIRNDYHNYNDRQRLEYNIYRLNHIQALYPYLEKIVVLLK